MTHDQQSNTESSHLLRQPHPNEDNAHDLFPAWLRMQIPDLSATRYETDPVIRCKFFAPDSFWTWYVIEAGITEDLEGNLDVLFYGYVEGIENELGYFCLLELQAARGPMGLPLERDLYFEPRSISSIIRIK